MKINSIIKRIALVITITGMWCGITNAQSQSQPVGKSEATIALSYYKKSSGETAVAVIKAKDKNGKFIPAKNAWVNFYVMHNKELQPLKKTVTDAKGQAIIALQKDIPLDDSLCFTIVAKIENDSLYEDAQEQMHYKDANLTISLDPHDTLRIATVKVSQMGQGGKEAPVNGADIKFYVQRMFGIMPAAEEYTVATDEKGEASFTYPKNIPGNTSGAISVVARIENNEKFGNVESSAETSWGVPLATIKDPFPRALWEPYAPLPLVITISILFGGVWFTYFFIFYQLRKIKKDSEPELKKA